MSMTNCPACNAEINEGVATCPKCGAPLDALYGLDTNMVDNSAAIDEMLRSAAQLMRDTEQFSFDDEELYGLNNSTPAADTYGDKETAQSVSADAPTLTAKQAGELSTGGVVNLTVDSDMAAAKAAVRNAPSAPVTAPAAAVVPPASTDFTPVSNDSISEDEDENSPMLAELDENGEIVQPAPEPPVKPEKQKAEKSVDSPAKNKKTSSGAIIVWIVVMTIIGAVAGFFLHALLFGEKQQGGDYAFAEKAATGLQSSFENGESLYIFDAYVKNTAAGTECVIYGGIKYGTGDMENQWLRFMVENTNPDLMNVYYELNEEYYYQLKNSGEAENAIIASVLKNYDNTLKEHIEEIKSGDQRWTRVDENALNEKLHPFKGADIEAENTAVSSAEEDTTDPSEEDITDLTD